MKYEQLSFLEPILKEEKNIKHDATICNRCRCSKCKYSVEIYPCLDNEEGKAITFSCFNCDECYYYGMDNENLSKNKIKFQCDKFEMSNYYVDLEAKKKRRNLKLV